MSQAATATSEAPSGVRRASRRSLARKVRSVTKSIVNRKLAVNEVALAEDTEVRDWMKEKVSLFQSLSDDDVEKVCFSAKLKLYLKGEHIVRQNDAGKFFYVIRSGRVDVKHTQPGSTSATTHSVHELGPTQSFGEIAVLGEDGQRTMSIVALTDVKCIKINRATFLAVLTPAAASAATQRSSTVEDIVAKYRAEQQWSAYLGKKRRESFSAARERRLGARRSSSSDSVASVGSRRGSIHRAKDVLDKLFAAESSDDEDESASDDKARAQPDRVSMVSKPPRHPAQPPLLRRTSSGIAAEAHARLGSLCVSASRSNLKLASSNPAEFLSGDQLDELRALFDAFDKDHSGQISSSELDSILRSLGEDHTMAEVKAMIARVDLDGNHEISFDEFTQMMAARVADEEQNEDVLLEAFKVFDEDDNGVIDKSEFGAVMRAQGEPLADDELAVIDAVESRTAGAIDYEEFVAMLRPATC